MRGYDYVRRNAVDSLEIKESSAQARVRGTGPVPYQVSLKVTPAGFASECSCPPFSTIHGHCKHVAAVLIALRDWSRSAEGASAPQTPPNGQTSHEAVVHATVATNTTQPPITQGGYGSASFMQREGSGGGRRGRRGRAARALKLALAARAGAVNVGLRGEGAGAVATGIEAWLHEPLPPMPNAIEYRLQVKSSGHGPGALSVTLLDIGTGGARTLLSPSNLLVLQGQSPTADREPIRLLARIESEGPRRGGAIELRGEDASDLLPLLKGRRVILEPQMMELRFGDEPLRPRFDLELSPDGTQILVKSCFVRAGDPRRFTSAQGAWFEGSPAWYLDAQEGVARPIDRRVAPASLRRLLRAPFIHEPIESLPQLIAQGLPRSQLEIGAELPDLSQVADVVNLVPTFRMRAGGSLVEARVSLRAAYEDVEMDVRADGMTPPVIVKPPVATSASAPGPSVGAPASSPATSPRPARARCIRCDIAAQQEAASQAARARPRPGRGGHRLRRAGGTTPSSSGPKGIGQLPEDWDLFVPDDLVDVNVRERGAERERPRVERHGLAVLAPLVRERGGRGHAGGARRVASPRGDGTSGWPTGRSRGSTPRRCGTCSCARPRSWRPAADRGASCRSPRPDGCRSCSSRSAAPCVSDGTKELFQKLRDIDEIKGDEEAAQPEGLPAPLPGAGVPLALVPERHRCRRRARRRHGARQDRAGAGPVARREGCRREERHDAPVQGAHRRPDERRDQLAARDGQVHAVAHARALARRRPQGATRTSSRMPTSS